MASASITITITDSTVTLADLRDTLCTQLGYAGLPNDNVAKIAFIKAYLVNQLRTQYNAGKCASSVATINGSANAADIS